VNWNKKKEKNKHPHKRTDSAGQNVLTKIVQNTAENLADVKARLKTTGDIESPKPLIKNREERKSDEDNKPTSPIIMRRFEKDNDLKNSTEKVSKLRKIKSSEDHVVPFVPTQNIAIQKVRVDLVNLIQPHVHSLAEMIKIEEKLQELIDISAQQAINSVSNSK